MSALAPALKSSFTTLSIERTPNEKHTKKKAQTRKKKEGVRLSKSVHSSSSTSSIGGHGEKDQNMVVVYESLCGRSSSSSSEVLVVNVRPLLPSSLLFPNLFGFLQKSS